MTERRLISTDSPFEKAGGYSRAVVQGPWIFISGTTGYDYASMILPDSMEEQAENCFRTIAGVLEEAGGNLADVVRVTYYVSDPGYAERMFPIAGRYFGEIRPAATLIVAGLLEPDMKIEIEVTALKREG